MKIEKVISILQSKQAELIQPFLQQHGVVLRQARLGFRSDYTSIIINGRHFVVSGVCGQDDLPVEIVYEL